MSWREKEVVLTVPPCVPVWAWVDYLFWNQLLQARKSALFLDISCVKIDAMSLSCCFP